jgi:hypothetical protein
MTHPNSTSKTWRGRALASLLAASSLVALAPDLAVAQSDAPDCVAIVAEMLTPTPSLGAIRASAGCPSSGPVTLGNRWTRRGMRGSGERAALVEASTLMRDSRLYDAVAAVVRDYSYPRADRLSGLRVLAEYANQSFPVIQQGQAYRARAEELSAGRTDGVVTTVTGSIALRTTVREEVRQELARLAREDRDPDFRFAARQAAENLGFGPSTRGEVARSPKR